MKKSILLCASIFLLNTVLIGQTDSELETVYAVGGDGTNVNWTTIKNESDPEGPGYFYSDCSQGVTPLKASSTLAAQGSKNYKI